MKSKPTIWLVVIVVLVLGSAGARTAGSPEERSEHFRATAKGGAAQAARVIRVSAERFAFTPSRIEIDAGEAVELHVKSDDTSHGFRIMGPDRSEAVVANVTIPKRGKGQVVVPLRIDAPGRYLFECSRMCGAGHNFMRGELIVRERTAGSDNR